MQIGLVLGGQTNKKLLKEIEEFGVNAGIAFQLRDDILGLFGDASTTGKPITDDIKEGKHTLLIDYCLTHANRKDIKYIKSKLGSGKVTNREFLKVQSIVRESRAEQYVEDKIAQYAKRAREVIDKSIFWKQYEKNLLKGLVNFSEGRKK
jgi:geranylgeranyl diphosphate synthase type I